MPRELLRNADGSFLPFHMNPDTWDRLVEQSSGNVSVPGFFAGVPVELNKYIEPGIIIQMRENDFRCARCGGTFPKAWTDEEAEAEAIGKYGGLEDMAVVCDNCWKMTGGLDDS